MARRVQLVSSLLLVTCMAASVLVLRALDRVRTGATLQQFLYISSPKLVKRLSLGYEGVLADIYWTRAVQYYGGIRHDAGVNYQLLWPLLNITTQLDPHIIPAYEYGATFLTARPPMGAGMPQQAIQLMNYGIENNPDDWHLYNDLGFIYYMDLKNYPKASETFLRGSEKPHAHPVLRILAALAAEHGGERQTAQMMWEEMYETTHDRYVREDAIMHLRALKVEEEIDALERMVNVYREKRGRNPESFIAMSREGLVRGIPVDPLGHPYQLGQNGKVFVTDPENFPVLERGLPPGYRPRVPGSSSPH